MRYPVTVLGATFEAIALCDALKAWRGSSAARRMRKACEYPLRDAREDHDYEIHSYLDDAITSSRGKVPGDPIPLLVLPPRRWLPVSA